jgi:hypothetical protein
LAIELLPAEHREWVASTIERIKTAATIAAGLEPTPVVHGAWLDIVYNYESLQQWASAEKARSAAIRVQIDYEGSLYWQELREKFLWPGIIAIIAALGAGIGGVLMEYFTRVLRFYSAHGLGALIRDEDFRKDLGLVAKDVQSALILPDEALRPPLRGARESVRPR